MTNREKYFRKTNEYDLLTKCQLRFARKPRVICMLDIISDHFEECPPDKLCAECIEEWLNKEAK